MTRDVDGGPPEIILLHQELQDVILVQLLIPLSESTNDLSQLTPVDHWENTGTVNEVLGAKRDSHIHELLLVLLHHITLLLFIYLLI